MHNWYLLLLAFLAVLQPIASFTDRNLVDGRQQCTTRSANRDARLTLYGTARNSKYGPEDRRVSYRETVEARQEHRRYEVSEPTHSERRIVDSPEREHRLGTHRESRLHQRDSRLFGRLDRERFSSPEDRARETREDARRISSARREVREISRSTRDVRHDARDSREFSDRASTTERRADSRNDRMSRIPPASHREERRVREPTRQPRYVTSFRVSRRVGDEVAQRESSRVREESHLADKSRIVRDDTRRDSGKTQERRSLDRVAEKRDLTERRSSSQEIFRDRESSRLADARHAERDSSRRDSRQMEERQALNGFAESRLVRVRRSMSLENFREREESRFVDNRRTERDSSLRDTRQMEERLALNRFAESRVVSDRRPMFLESFREREENLLANGKRTERANSRRDTRQTEQQRALDRFAERQGVSDRRSVSLDNFREREETRMVDNRRTERASSRRDVRQMNERQALNRFSERRDVRDRRSVSQENFREREESRLADNRRTERANSRRDARQMEESRVREQNRREISERRMSIPETLRVREGISLADGRLTERISSRRVHENSEERRSLESRIAHRPSLNSRDASRNRDLRDESRISRVDVLNEQDSQRMIPMQRLAVEKRETSRANRERDMRNVARESSDRSAFTRGLEEMQARIRSTEARAIRSERVAGNRRDIRLNYDAVQRIQKEQRSVGLEASDERKDTRLQQSAETRNDVVRMQEKRHLSASSRRMNQSENRNSRDERRDTTMERSKRSETRNSNDYRMQDRERVPREESKIRESTKTRDTRKMQREQDGNNRIGSRSEDGPRSMRMEARNIQHLALERDVISSRQASEKTSSEPGQLFMMNWHYLLYTVQGLYLCSMLAEMLGVHQSEKKIRSHGFWSASKIIKLD